MEKILKLSVIIVCFLYSATHSFAQSADGAVLVLQKTYNNETTETNAEFAVDKKLNTLLIDVSGKVKSGRITISLMPLFMNVNQKTFTLDNSSDMEYHQVINLKKMPQYVGVWMIHVKVENADGYYDFKMKTTAY
jgi:hypothetical protein